MPQQATTGPAPMEGIERTNMVIVREVGPGAGSNVGVPSRRDSYAIEIDRRRNCYTYRGFGHMDRHCRNWEQRGRVMDGRRVEYGEGRFKSNIEQIEHLKEMENLEALD